jgi:hypothetical protein
MFWKHVDDVIALVIVGGCFIAIYCHIDSQAWALLGAAAAWEFRSGMETRHRG